MRVLAVVALAGVLFASTGAHAIIVKDKKRKKESAYAESAESKTKYVKTNYSKRSNDRHTGDIRRPTLNGRVKPAPKKLRTRTHISEWP